MICFYMFYSSFGYSAIQNEVIFLIINTLEKIFIFNRIMSIKLPKISIE